MGQVINPKIIKGDSKKSVSIVCSNCGTAYVTKGDDMITNVRKLYAEKKIGSDACATLMCSAIRAKFYEILDMNGDKLTWEGIKYIDDSMFNVLKTMIESKLRYGSCAELLPVIRQYLENFITSLIKVEDFVINDKDLEKFFNLIEEVFILDGYSTVS